MSANKEVGHVFLARLGKKRLRPGGKAATDWLMSETAPQAGERVLEVACNQGTTLIELAKKGCVVTGLDMDGCALEKCRANLKEAGLQDKVKVIQGDARALPFEDGTFDVVVNEAMLTMLPHESRSKALKEYYRVLKKGGRLMTHDVALLGAPEGTSGELSKSINAQVKPEQPEEWVRQIKAAGFEQVNSKLFPFSLMNPTGMIRDEGLFGAIKIMWRGRRPENREMFNKMKNFFTSRRKVLRAFAAVSKKD